MQRYSRGGFALYALLLIVLKTIFMLWYTSELSIGYDEAKIVFGAGGLAHWLSNASLSIFGFSDAALRAPFIALHALSALMLFVLARRVLTKDGDALLALAIFLLLPGVNAAALLVNKAGILLFSTLLFVLLYERSRVLSYSMLFILSFCDNAFATLFLALIFYGMYKRDRKLIVFAAVLFGISMSRFGFDDGGKPKGYWPDTFGVYAAIFSPLLFIYFVYALYKFRRIGGMSIGWTISFWAFVFSLLLSFRQRIEFSDFAPFVVIAVPMMLRVFLSSYRVRIAPNRTGYKAGFAFVVSTLLLCTTVTFANKPLYRYISTPQKHFAYEYQIAKELASELSKMGVAQIDCDDEKMALRLRFYGISAGGGARVGVRADPAAQKIEISYSGVVVARYYVTKVNTQEPQ